MVKLLEQYHKDGITIGGGSPRERYFACDTEVAGIDITNQSPVGHGTVVCFSIYAGPDADFNVNNDPPGVKQPRLWVDLGHAAKVDDATGKLTSLDLSPQVTRGQCSRR